MAKVGSVAIACPRCSSTNVEPLPRSDYACKHCNTHFHFVRQQPQQRPPQQPNPNYRPPPPPPARPHNSPWSAQPQASIHVNTGNVGRRMLVSMVTGLMITGVTVGVAFCQIGSIEIPEIPEIKIPTAPQTGTKQKNTGSDSAPSPDAPKAALTGTKEGEAKDGTKYWITLYQNKDTVAIDHPKVKAIFLDGSGKKVGEAVGSCEKEHLAAGQAFPVLISADKVPSHKKVELTPIDIKAARYDAKQLDLIVMKRQVVPLPGGVKQVTGEIRNEKSDPLSVVEVIVAGRDAKGAVVSYGHGLAKPSDVGAGKTAKFTVDVGKYSIEKPKRYDVYALGRKR